MKGVHETFSDTQYKLTYGGIDRPPATSLYPITNAAQCAAQLDFAKNWSPFQWEIVQNIVRRPNGLESWIKPLGAAAVGSEIEPSGRACTAVIDHAARPVLGGLGV